MAKAMKSCPVPTLPLAEALLRCHHGESNADADDNSTTASASHASRSSNTVTAATLDSYCSDDESEYWCADDEIVEQVVRASDSSLPKTQDLLKEVFLHQLRQKRGAVLRAWRMDIDVRSSGKVSYVDFVQQCRKTGILDQPSEFQLRPKPLWDAFCTQGQPLEFAALCPEEADNVESFAEVLWMYYGCNVDKIWEFMDVCRQKWISLHEFEEVAAELGFNGNVKLLFRGIDSSGLGRLRREDLEYVAKIARVSRTMSGKGAVTDFIAWTKREYGSLDALLGDLGLGSDLNRTQISVSDLAVTLTALGFEGDATEVAKHAARGLGAARCGTVVTIETLQNLLSSRSEQTQELTESRARMVAALARTKSKKQLEGPREWNGSFCNVSAVNISGCKASRSYFSTPDTDDQAMIVARSVHGCVEAAHAQKTCRRSDKKEVAQESAVAIRPRRAILDEEVAREFVRRDLSWFRSSAAPKVVQGFNMTVADLRGKWITPEGGIFEFKQDGVQFNNEKLSSQWNLEEATDGSIFSKAQSKHGWFLSKEKSSIDHMVWEMTGKDDVVWIRAEQATQREIKQPANKVRAQSRCGPRA